MDIVSADNDKICSRCEKTLQSIESVMKVTHVSDDHLRNLSGSWFYHHRQPSAIFRTPAVDCDSVYEHTAKYLFNSAPMCIFCSFLLSKLSPTWSKMWQQQHCFTSLSQGEIALIEEELGDQPVSLCRSHLGKSWKSKGLSIERPGNFENTITLYTDHDPHALSDRIGERLSPMRSSNCSEAFEFIQKQAIDCHSHHMKCHGNRIELSTPPRLPSRVLDLGPAQGSKDVRLLETHSAMHGFYTALSHCWGPEHKRPLTTMNSTLEKRKLGIDWNDLPQTFQDAVATSRAIGVQYLWIDSLCIVQDDTDDWRRESAKMADVYMNAWVTIAASYARDSTEGLFDACYRPSLELLELPHYDSSGTRSSPIFVGAAHGPLGGPGGHVGLYWEVSQPDLEVLATRGWTTQEALLSHCIVYFTRQFLFWCCRTTSIDEKGIEYHPKTSPRQHDDTWYRVVREFSQRSLTYPTDKLIALEGILSHFRTTETSVYGEEFVFGHWTKHIPNCLLWSTTQANKHLNPLVMPTWSWVSSMSPVYWHYWAPNLQSRCEVIALPTSTDPQIVLRGKVKILAETDNDIRRSGGRTAGSGYQLDEDMEAGPIYGLLVAIYEDEDEPFKEDRSQVLLLQRTLASENTYGRVGIVNFWTDEWFDGCPLQEITLV